MAQAAPFPLADPLVRRTDGRLSTPWVHWFTTLQQDVQEAPYRLTTVTVEGQTAAIGATALPLGALATLASIDAKMSGARGLVAEAQLAKGDASLKTPMGGVILKKLVEVGSLVGPGTPGFVIADTRSVKVVIGVPDTMLGRFPLGAVEVVQTEAQPDRRYEGRVTSISPTADLKSRLFEVQLTLGNADGALKPGMVVSIEPGYYRPGAFGIRIENLAVVVPAPDGSGGRPMLAFEPLTLVPIDRALVLPDLRGYGRSSKPEGGTDHSAYAKRAMAQDMAQDLGQDLGQDMGQPATRRGPWG